MTTKVLPLDANAVYAYLTAKSPELVRPGGRIVGFHCGRRDWTLHIGYEDGNAKFWGGIVEMQKSLAANEGLSS